MRSIATLTLAALVAACAVGADANAQAGKASLMFMMLDKNGDNVIDRNELQAQRTRMFTEMDANADGEVTATEMAEARTNMRQGFAARLAQRARSGPPSDEERKQAFVRLDANGDGLLSRSEFVDPEPVMLTLGDANSDGRLDRQEVSDLIQSGQTFSPFTQQ